MEDMHDNETIVEEEVVSGETNEQRFKRVASRRLNAALKQMRLLRNCSVHSYYEYTPEQVTTIVTALQQEVERVKDAFAGVKDDEPEIKL